MTASFKKLFIFFLPTVCCGLAVPFILEKICRLPTPFFFFQHVRILVSIYMRTFRLHVFLQLVFSSFVSTLLLSFPFFFSFSAVEREEKSSRYYLKKGPLLLFLEDKRQSSKQQLHSVLIFPLL